LSRIEAAWAAIGGPGLIYEKFQDFSREISIVGAARRRANRVLSPLGEHTRWRHLHYSIAPFRNTKLERSARTYLKRVMNALDYVGVLTIEFFVVKGRLIANEMAPRVHNSGHWTIEGCVTSQFENHLRAICDLPLGSTRALGHTAMVNFLGKCPTARRFWPSTGWLFTIMVRIRAPAASWATAPSSKSAQPSAIRLLRMP
jgi:5-(carboxyamino)imidazole ribonucleotide synthase